LARLLLHTESVEVNSMDEFGHTPLWWAIKNEREVVVQLLKSYGGSC
jgi:ankyrin repeat protein